MHNRLRYYNTNSGSQELKRWKKEFKRLMTSLAVKSGNLTLVELTYCSEIEPVPGAVVSFPFVFGHCLQPAGQVELFALFVPSLMLRGVEYVGMDLELSWFGSWVEILCV